MMTTTFGRILITILTVCVVSMHSSARAAMSAPTPIKHLVSEHGSARHLADQAELDSQQSQMRQLIELMDALEKQGERAAKKAPWQGAPPFYWDRYQPRMDTLPVMEKLVPTARPDVWERLKDSRREFLKKHRSRQIEGPLIPSTDSRRRSGLFDRFVPPAKEAATEDGESSEER